MQLTKEDDLQNTSLLFIHQTRIRSQITYSVTLIAVLAVIGLLPFLYTTVSVKGTGLIQSNIEKIELLAPASGRLISVKLKDNLKVLKGTTLLTIDATLPNQQKNLIGNHEQQIEQQLQDVQILLSNINKPFNSINSEISIGKLSTGLYMASWQQYIETLQNATNAKEQANRIYQRYQILYSKKVVTQAEYEQYQFNYNQSVSDWKMVNKKYKTQWQTESNQYRNELRDLQNQQVQLTDQEKQYSLKATVTGSIQNLTGVQAGAYVYANQKLGEISPDSALLAYCYIKPSDIGLIKKRQHVRFRIDAFNYNQWGLIYGQVLDISDDIIIQNQSPYFRVKCKLDKDFLQLKNGYRGQVKKGMTFSANFTVTKRSLYQLLYDQVDDWLNPNGFKD
ncbi:HlyD family secretion protein [Pedobacter paludis]|uniref:Secretion protein HlyD n=1 Tax=Pedobacter paludis TaxID=2203212 RepID=A0A317F0L0_9SPHI|nr:HlyD family efflux transporter periplasmic adaptor subunit [Pedobacter paludis]PWS31793.1 secretion protein HlyD [Pedobacter paludis]